MGEIDKSKILDVLERFPWNDLIDKMNNAVDQEIHFSPSLEFENTTNRHGLSISIIDEDNANEFYIFYKRPKLIKKLFGLIRNMDDNYLSDRPGQTISDVRDAVNALIANDLPTLEKRWA